ncbi:acyl-CoA dehydrogenase family protein [Metallumcola ferriviriculae]|uniref:Acyl-CoA dehydrogenase family protein n=1 Tax=Metallumcola ferriviriculae TaxID=3039180 RepID=A0AAU0UMN2_9FIRM|nr:acyl-CoA dehydrogenase family protein [Desulfitibacteraceae bacterium MK1]
MGYSLNDQQLMLSKSVRRLAEKHVSPRAEQLDRSDEYPWDLWREFAANDLVGVSIPEIHGGKGQGVLELCLVVEELSRVSAATGLMVSCQELALTPLLLAGSAEQKKNFLVAGARGEVLASFALTEPDAGSDVSATGTRAVRRGEEYIINGSKCFITNGGLAEYYIVFAATDKEQGIRGLSAFVVEKDRPGLSIGKVEDKMGVRGTRTTELIFEDCKVPRANLIGSEGDGFKLAMLSLDRVRPAIGAQALGIARGALEYALNYCKQRRQFSRPIVTLQGLQFMLSEMFTKVEASRHLVYSAASLVDEEFPGLNGANKEISRLSAMAKMYASDTAMAVTTDAVQLLGGYGYMREFPVERMMRDAKIIQIYGGTNQIQRVVISRSLLG